MSETTLSNRQQKTRLIFMNAFLRLISQHTLDRITVTDIANEANYGRWAFYHYFESKEAIAWATFVYWMTHLDAHMLASVQHLASPWREYESWRIIFQAFAQQRHILLRMDSLVDPSLRTRAKEFLIQQFLQHLQAGHFALIAGVRPEVAARLYVVALMELLAYWGQNPSLGTPESLVDEFFVFIFNQAPPK